MVTFTFRISQDVATRLSSAEMRTWITDFFRYPHALPPDPGPGDGRISLTLPGESVCELAASLHCAPSSALRRLAVERLGIERRAVPTVASKLERRSSPSVEGLTAKRHRIAALQNYPQAPMTEKKSGGWGFLFAGAIAFLVFLFFGFGPGNAPE